MSDGTYTSADSDQLELDMGEPWGGRSPRGLTKGFSLRKLRHGPGEPERFTRRQKDAPTKGRNLQLWLFGDEVI